MTANGLCAELDGHRVVDEFLDEGVSRFLAALAGSDAG
jgi:hypothetical protein